MGRLESLDQFDKPDIVQYEHSTKQAKADQNQEIHECIYGWDTESCRCWGFVREVEVTTLVDPDLCRDCYCKREEGICDSYDKEIDRCEKSIGRYKEYLHELGRDDPLTSSLIVQTEKDLDGLKTARRESLKIFHSSQGVWVGPCRATALFSKALRRSCKVTFGGVSRKKILCCLLYHSRAPEC